MRLIFSDANSILDDLAHQKWDDISWQRLRIESILLKSEKDDGLVVLDQLKNRIHLLPHQIKTAIKVKNFMKYRAILADEVGLGKTIEAGIIIKECICRGLVEKILILSPPSLLLQWQGEMLQKFSEKFVVASSADKDFRGLDMHDKLIVSLDLAKRGLNSEHLKDVRWDIVVIDEAHRLKNSSSLAYTFVKELTSKYFLLLTATPLQNNLRELYNIITLLRPDLLGTWKEFHRDFILDSNGRIVKDHVMLQNILSKVMIRTGRRETEEYLKFTERIPHTIRIEPTEEERRLYQSVTNYVKSKYFEVVKDDVVDELKIFSLIMFQRQLASSSAAVVKAIQNKLQNTYAPSETLELSRLLNDALSVKNDSKLLKLLSMVEEFDSKVLIFTTFLETQRRIARALGEQGILTFMFSGDMSNQKKDEAIARFKEHGKVLICTEAGSEGRNLQFCNTLVNYDLPWNPMRIEQRIGRIHRIGQEKDVYIYNFVIEDTVEDYIMKVLYDKIRLFEMAIGDLELILGDEGEYFEKRIFEDYMETLSKGELENRLGILRKETIEKKNIAEDIQEFDRRVFQNFDLSPLSTV